MKRVFLGWLFLSLFLLEAMAGEETVVDGYVRGTYHSSDFKEDKVYQDDAIGGKIHFETASTDGVSLGASYYGSTKLLNDDNGGIVPLRGEQGRAYGIFGEVYLKYESENSMFKVGRQEIETPFAQSDDIGMVPNSFESLLFSNSGIENTTIFLGQVNKMAGVDAEVIDRFTKVNGSNNMQFAGLIYEGIENLTLSGWYYRLKGGLIDKITYIEANYENRFNRNYSYSLGFQHSKQNYHEGEDAKVSGGTLRIISENLGLTLATAYTKVEGGEANSGFGGGPFFSNSEYLIIDNVGADGMAKWIGAELDGSRFGLQGLSVGVGKIILEKSSKEKATEIDFVVSYRFNSAIDFHAIYSDLKAKSVDEGEAKYLRLFANYNF